MTMQSKNLKLMGIDLGDASIGIAFSDDLGITAQAFETYRRISKKKDVDYLVDLTLERRIRKIIVGLPLLMNGDVGEQAQKTLDFVKALEKKLNYTDKLEEKVFVELQDERLTSKFADVLMKEAELSRKERAKKIDKVAAAMILQTYMDKG